MEREKKKGGGWLSACFFTKEIETDEEGLKEKKKSMSGLLKCTSIIITLGNEYIQL